ncbi:MAG: hypothetical protein HRT37_01735 [Alteromonadaceae bacterium]|nr:hypothetical protein [Alteromonadaceae bacterium]
MKYLLLLLSLGASSASAGYIYCTGKVENIYIHQSGDIVIYGEWRKDFTKICNTKNSDVVTCSLWASSVTTAVKDNPDVKVQYFVSDDTTCATLGTYQNAPDPGYVMILNPVI